MENSPLHRHDGEGEEEQDEEEEREAVEPEEAGGATECAGETREGEHEEGGGRKVAVPGAARQCDDGAVQRACVREAQLPAELPSQEEEEEVELVDWDDDDFKAAFPTASDTLGGATLTGQGAGCAAPRSVASLAPSFAATPAETLIPPLLRCLLPLLVEMLRRWDA